MGVVLLLRSPKKLGDFQMVFAGKKGGRKIDAFGPGDILLASAGLLHSEYSKHVVRFVTDDAFVEHAANLMAGMHRDDVEVFNQICGSAFAGSVSLASQRESTRDREELTLVFSLAGKCLKVFGFQFEASERVEELSLIYAAVKGATRMAELRRPEQAMLALSLAFMIVAHVINEKAGDVQIFTASWGEKGVNKCIFFINDKGEVSWTPNSSEPSFIAEDRIMSALAEIEIALGRTPSFVDELNAKSDFFEGLIRDGQASATEASVPFFNWDPPLSQLKKVG